MVEQLRALEERFNLLQQEYHLAKERHEFLNQYEIREEMKRLIQQHRELKEMSKCG